MASRRLCVNCRARPPRWRPPYSPLPAQFCTMTCAANYAHELIADDGDDDHAARVAREETATDE